MTEERRDIFGEKPGLLTWLRDLAYDFVYYEIGTAVDFVGDLIRGPSGYSKSLHRQTERAEARAKTETPLTKAEKQVFVDMIRREPGEPQIAYWKRKKALLANPDKKDLVQQQTALLKAREARQRGQIQVEAATVGGDYGRHRSQTRKATERHTQGHPARRRR